MDLPTTVPTDLLGVLYTIRIESASERVNFSRDTGLSCWRGHATARGPCHGEIFASSQDDTVFSGARTNMNQT